MNADCTNIEGSFTCQCITGYYGDGYNCTGEFLSRIHVHLCQLKLFSVTLRDLELVCIGSNLLAITYHPPYMIHTKLDHKKKQSDAEMQPLVHRSATLADDLALGRTRS